LRGGYNAHQNRNAGQMAFEGAYKLFLQLEKTGH
jgi:hypothetical protein